MPRASIILILSVLAATNAAAAPIVFSGAGAAATTARDNFRTAVGGGVVAGPGGSFGGVRREINWDGVPDAFSTPNFMPGNFFSARGIVFGGESSQFTNSADDTNPTSTATNFANFNPQYGTQFTPFSPQRLFSPVDNNVFTNFFFVPGSAQPASVSAFGIMFADVDVDNLTFLQFNLSDGTSQTFFVPAGNETHSFLGVRFNAGERVLSVRAGLGNLILGQGLNEGPVQAGFNDIVAMDDFLFAEPQAVPEPATCAMLGSALVLLGVMRSKRKR